MMNTRSAIECRSLTKTFQTTKGQKVNALNGLSLTIHEGEIFGFLGQNGAGKSTTIKLILDLIRPTSGEVVIFGAPSKNPISRREVGYLPENPSFYDSMTASEYLRFIGKSFHLTNHTIATESERLLRLFELWDARNRMLRNYSKGMVQKLGLAQALLHNPRLLILDEPMSGLDPLARVLVKEVLLEQKKLGKTIFFSTHILSDVEQVCDRAGIIHRGELRIVADLRDLLRGGIEGYRITYANALPGEDSITVPPSGLKGTLQSLEDSHREIGLVEPLRKSLETLFVDIVNDSRM